MHRSITTNQSRRRGTGAVLVLWGLAGGLAGPLQAAVAPPAVALAGLAVPFEENRGQLHEQVAFQARTLAGPLFVTRAGELVWRLGSGDRGAADWVLVERFAGGTPRPAGGTPSPTRVSRFDGTGSRAPASASSWGRVALGEVWPGVRVALAARGRNVEKLFTLAPGTAAGAIALTVDGGRLALGTDGSLVVHRPGGGELVRFTTPVAWQELAGGRAPVAVRYRLAAADGSRYGFTLGAHDPDHPVFIDPLIQSTYLGGSADDWACGVAAVGDRVYVAGTTSSADFPGVDGGAYPTSYGTDAFVAKLTSDLTAIIHASYFGGGYTQCGAMAAAADDGSVYLAGTTYEDLPAGSTDGGAYPGPSVFGDGFVARFSEDLTTLHQATYLGGYADDGLAAMVVAGEDLYVAGHSRASDFPGTQDGVQLFSYETIYTLGNTTYGFHADAVVARLSRDLTTLHQATYLGGSGDDYAHALAVSGGTVYVAGETLPTDGGTAVAFVDAVAADLRTRVAGPVTALGPSATVSADALAATAEGLYVGGARAAGDGTRQAYLSRLAGDLSHLEDHSLAGLQVTGLAPFPAGGGVYATGPAGSDPVSGFLTRLPCTGSAGPCPDADPLTEQLAGASPAALAVSDAGVYMAGHTYAADLPGTAGGAQPVYAGAGQQDAGGDAFVARYSLPLPDSYPLTVTVSGGSVTSIPAGIDCGLTCNVDFDPDTPVTLTAVPALAGDRFNGWGGDCTAAGTSAFCTLVMDAPKVVSASYASMVGVQASRAGFGRIEAAAAAGGTGIACGNQGTRTLSDCLASYPRGQSLTLTATAEPGSFVALWGGACEGQGATGAGTTSSSCTLTPDADLVVLAVFAQSN
jgi:hypothetical protein